MPRIGIDQANDIIHLADLIKDNHKKIRDNNDEIVDALYKCYIDSVHKIKDREQIAYQLTLDYINKQKENLNNLEMIIKERIV